MATHVKPQESPSTPATNAVSPPSPPNPPSQKSSQSKKKVRVQEIVIHDQPEKPVDVFHVRISQVRGRLRVVEPRPVILTFEFDSYWYAETDIYSRDIEPVWRFNESTIRGFDGRRPASQSDLDAPSEKDDQPTRPKFSSDARFVYETEFGFKLHRKYLIVRLAERSPYGDVEWGSAVVPIDSIARGCDQLNLSILAPDGVTCYGNVFFNVQMVNIQNVRVHLTDMKLLEYPEAFNYDVKLICLDIGVSPFENGYDICTEKRSEAEPRFAAQPTLERATSLRDMLVSSTSGAPSLKIFFSARRQVARDRTEEIGVGALPIRYLFGKVAEGWMDVPTKFKVPLSGLKGIIRGKVILRNIPQFSQLPGTDLVNVDGVIQPSDVDVNSRKLLPWLKLPRSMEPRSRSGSTAERSVRTVVPASGSGGGDGSSTRESSLASDMADGSRKGSERRRRRHGQQSETLSNGRTPLVMEAVSEEGSESSSTGVARTQDALRYGDGGDERAGREGWDETAETDQSVGQLCGQLESSLGNGALHAGGTNEALDEGGNEGNKSDGHAAWTEGEQSGDGADFTSKSGKSVGSCGTAEVGSAAFSGASDDGYSVGALVGEENGTAARPEQLEEEDNEWIGIHHTASQQFYFVNRYTQESLWLPSDWARAVDDHGHQYFLDHGSKKTQRAFPAAEARAYRESVYGDRELPQEEEQQQAQEQRPAPEAVEGRVAAAES